MKNAPLQEPLPHRVGLCRIVPHVDVRVVEGFLHRDAAFWINDQHFGQQVPCLTRCYCNREREKKTKTPRARLHFSDLHEK